MSDHPQPSPLCRSASGSAVLSTLSLALLLTVVTSASLVALPPPAQLDEGLSADERPPLSSALWLPPAKRAQWRALLSGPSSGQALVSLHYGDSHTQGAFLSRALRDELSSPSAQRDLDEPSPGFVHAGHPHAWGGEVELNGHWLRQNWIYGGDQGPFGPLGISFVTQDRLARATLSLDNPPLDAPAQVTIFYADEPSRLGFCLKALPDPDQPSRAAQRRAALREALPRYESHFHPPRPDQGAALGEPEDEEELKRGQSLNRASPVSEALQVLSLSSEQPTSGGPLGALGSERGLCVPSSQVTSPSSDGEALRQLTLQLPAGYMLQLTTQRGAKITDQTVKRWRKRRARAKRRRRAGRRDAQRVPPDLIYPEKPRLRLLGYHVRYPNAKVEWNTLGVRGARVKSAALRHEGSIQTLSELTQAQLFVLWFGTNSAAAEAVNLKTYERQFRSLVTTLKASAPQAQCLIITAPDFGRRPRDCYLNSRELRALNRRRKTAWTRQTLAENRAMRVCAPERLLNTNKTGRHRYPFPKVLNERDWETYQARCAYFTPPLVSQLTQIQQRVGREEGCAIYDTLTAMGGEGSVRSWACAEPRWAQLDLVHLSAVGYEALGAHIARSLRYELDLDERPPPRLAPPREPSEEPLDRAAKQSQP